MTATESVSALLHEAAETHHIVYRIVDGDDPDWASWYADWLLDHSELPQLLGSAPVRSHLVHELVQLDRDYTSERGYQMGEFDLVRFRPSFKPGEENHIGEAIVDGDGAIAYLKTFRLSEAQIRRGYLLELLAAHNWRLSAAAKAIGTTPEDLRGRIRAAGFETILRQKEKP